MYNTKSQSATPSFRPHHLQQLYVLNVECCTSNIPYSSTCFHEDDNDFIPKNRPKTLNKPHATLLLTLDPFEQPSHTPEQQVNIPQPRGHQYTTWFKSKFSKSQHFISPHKVSPLLLHSLNTKPVKISKQSTPWINLSDIPKTHPSYSNNSTNSYHQNTPTAFPSTKRSRRSKAKESKTTKAKESPQENTMIYVECVRPWRACPVRHKGEIFISIRSAITEWDEDWSPYWEFYLTHDWEHDWYIDEIGDESDMRYDDEALNWNF